MQYKSIIHYPCSRSTFLTPVNTGREHGRLSTLPVFTARVACVKKSTVSVYPVLLLRCPAGAVGRFFHDMCDLVKRASSLELTEFYSLRSTVAHRTFATSSLRKTLYFFSQNLAKVQFSQCWNGYFVVVECLPYLRTAVQLFICKRLLDIHLQLSDNSRRPLMSWVCCWFLICWLLCRKEECNWCIVSADMSVNSILQDSCG